MKFLVDMNLSRFGFPSCWSTASNRFHWSTVGQPEAADSEIFDFAATNGWIVFTHDLDFGMLLAALRTSKPSVIQVRTQDVLPSAIGDIVLRAIQTAKPYLGVGALVTVDSFRDSEESSPRDVGPGFCQHSRIPVLILRRHLCERVPGARQISLSQS